MTDPMSLPDRIAATTACTCVPCTTPAYGYPGIDHCAACCRGSGIAEYDVECPDPEHRQWARLQWGVQP